MKKAISIVLPLAATLAFGLPSLAGPPFQVDSNITLQADESLRDTTLTVSGPDGYYQEQSSRPGSGPVILNDPGVMPDGTYTWQITGRTTKRIVTAKDTMNNGRSDGERGYSYETIVQSGSFTMANGSRIDTTLVEK